MRMNLCEGQNLMTKGKPGASKKLIFLGRKVLKKINLSLKKVNQEMKVIEAPVDDSRINFMR